MGDQFFVTELSNLNKDFYTTTCTTIATTSTSANIPMTQEANGCIKKQLSQLVRCPYLGFMQ